MSYRQELIKRIVQYGLDQRSLYWKNIKDAVQKNMLDDDMGELLLFQMEPDVQQQIDYPDYLHRVPTPEQLYAQGMPEVRLGYIKENPELIFGIRFDMPLHMIVAGLTGFGKTTLMRTLQKGIYQYNLKHPDKKISVIVFDRKGNDYADLPEMFQWLHYNVHDGFWL